MSFNSKGELIKPLYHESKALFAIEMKPIIKVENVSKSYRMAGGKGQYSTLRDTIADVARFPLRAFSGENSQDKNVFWAWRDVSFNVNPGEVVGIIGSNGAGKSTILKILSRITEPTEGRIELFGRVGSLLEVGTGFHPELTGRENIFLNGCILGMKRELIAKRFDEIVEFAGISKFLDTPVKFYSSGMYMRLAFAVAAHLEPEILIIDEVLAVGDAEFQKKCLAKMEAVSTQDGRTVIFVSHDTAAVQSLCSKSILLRDGKLINVGNSKMVIKEYLNTDAVLRPHQKWENIEDAPGNDAIRLKEATITAEGMQDSQHIRSETPARIDLQFYNLSAGSTHLGLVLVLWTSAGEFFVKATSRSIELQYGLCRSALQIPKHFLSKDEYIVEIYFMKDISTMLYKHNNLISFAVSDVRDSFDPNGEDGTHFPGLDFDLSSV